LGATTPRSPFPVLCPQMNLLNTLTPGKDPVVFAEQEAKWAPELVWMIWSREKSVAPIGS